jgi:hypothetical protein
VQARLNFAPLELPLAKLTLSDLAQNQRHRATQVVGYKKTLCALTMQQ